MAAESYHGSHFVAVSMFFVADEVMRLDHSGS